MAFQRACATFRAIALDPFYRGWEGSLGAAAVTKKRLPEGWLLSTSGSAPRQKAVVLNVGSNVMGSIDATAVTIPLPLPPVNQQLETATNLLDSH